MLPREDDARTVALPLPAGHTITVFCRHFRWPPNGRFGPICIIVSDICADCSCGTVSRLLHVRMHLPILWLHDPPALFDFRISTFLFPLLPPLLPLQPDSDAAWLSAFDVRRRRRCQIYLPDVRV